MRYKLFITAIASLQFLLSSCQKDNIAALPEEAPKISAMNWPESIIQGLTVKAASLGVQRDDTAHMYLRPVSGGQDVRVMYGDKYGNRTEDNRIPYSPFEVVFTTPEDIPEGEYQFVIKRGNEDIVIERCSAPIITGNDDYDRLPVTTNNIRVGKAELDPDNTVFARGQEVIVYGNEFNNQDSIYMVQSGVAQAPMIPASISEIEKGGHMKFIIPKDCAENAKYNVVFVRRKARKVLGMLSVKPELSITGIVLPSSAPVEGSTVTIQASGCNSSDKIILNTKQGSEIIDANIDGDGIQFEMPAGLGEKPILVQLYRDSELPLFNIGYISYGKTIDITDIPESGFGSIPDELPKGYPYNLSGVQQNLIITVQGTGFSKSDKIRFNGTESDITLMGNIVQFALNTQSVSGEQSIELVRGSNSITLKKVNIVGAPKKGDYAEGGVVVWIDPSRPTHGLVCDIKDYSEGDKMLSWAKTPVYTTRDKDILSSLENTRIILSVHGEQAEAADYCDKLVVNVGDKVYDDWALPSEMALDMMRKNMAIINQVSLANGGTELNKTAPNNSCFGYASSTQNFVYSSYSVSFNGSTSAQYDNILKKFYVRAVRTF